MKKHFMTHQGRCACNANLKNVAMSDNWKDLEINGCKRCKKSGQYQMAKQLWKEENDHHNFKKALNHRVDFCIKLNNNCDEVFDLIKSCDTVWNRYMTKSNNNFKALWFTRKNNHYIVTVKSLLNSKIKQFSFKDDCFVDEIEKSACGKTLDEFIEACNDDCSNVEFNSNYTWIDTYYHEITELVKGLRYKNHQHLKRYRIKPTPSKEPVKYTISEDNLKEIKRIIKDGIQCNIKYFDGGLDSELSKMAVDIKHKALFDIMHILPKTYNHKIKGE